MILTIAPGLIAITAIEFLSIWSRDATMATFCGHIRNLMIVGTIVTLVGLKKATDR